MPIFACLWAWRVRNRVIEALNNADPKKPPPPNQEDSPSPGRTVFDARGNWKRPRDKRKKRRLSKERWRSSIHAPINDREPESREDSKGFGRLDNWLTSHFPLWLLSMMNSSKGGTADGREREHRAPVLSGSKGARTREVFPSFRVRIAPSCCAIQPTCKHCVSCNLCPLLAISIVSLRQQERERERGFLLRLSSWDSKLCEPIATLIEEIAVFDYIVLSLTRFSFFRPPQGSQACNLYTQK